MLRSLNYHVTFSSTGRTFRNQLRFEPGLTAITGKNEEGKSLIIELIGYCLFGKAALRGLASDYKDLVVESELVINDKHVKIYRATIDEFLYLEGKEIARGADAINRTVPQLLGFGLDVYRIALVAEQDDLQALTNMRPTARRAMVDQLSGTGALENVEKECKVEAKQREAVALHLLTSSTEPTKPEQPKNYRPSHEIEEEIKSAEQLQRNRETWKRVLKPDQPIAPDRPAINASLADLEEHQKRRQLLLESKARLEGELAGIPEPEFTAEQLAQILCHNQYMNEKIRRGPEPDPSYSLEQLKEFAHRWDLKFKLAEVEECPRCGFEFDPVTGEEAIKWQEPPLTSQQVKDQITYHMRWLDPLVEPEISFEILDPIDLRKEELAHASIGHADRLRSELQKLTVPVDRSEDYVKLRDYEREQAVFIERAECYERDFAAWQEAQTALSQTDDPIDLLNELYTSLAYARHYEKYLSQYEIEFQHWSEICTQISDKKEEAEGFVKGMQALKETRIRVKQELLPSLSKAASILLSSLTNGERKYVGIDEDFNVIVDGQPLRTLSGSGKAVVNLALRIGLGQVLTAKVLSLFIGDEIDGSMDSNRAGSTHLTFKNLTKHVNQIILVTHKNIEADNIIDLSAISTSKSE